MDMARIFELGILTLTASLLVAQAVPEGTDDDGRYEPVQRDSSGNAGEAKPAAPAPKSPAPAPAQKPTIGLDYQIQAWSVVNASTNAINDCIEKHLQVQPTAAGNVDLQLDVSGDGKMLKVGTRSSLAASEKLQQCLKFIAQSWKFPRAEGVEKFSTSLQIKVAKGQKFSLAKPGEKPAANKPAQAPQGESGFVGFSPTWSTGFKD